jgi:tRNA threonylcarbamoyladenosine biosynthesis protein TsaB
MNILAFETGNFSFSAALLRKEEVLVNESLEAERGQDRILISLLSKMLEKAGLVFKDISLIVTTTGPGSFTGLRVGLAAAKGFHLALGVPVIGVSSFQWYCQSLLQKSKDNKNILIVLESKREEVFCQLFDSKGDSLKPPVCLLPSDVASYCSEGSLILSGNGAHHIVPHISQQKIELIEKKPSAVDLGIFAWHLYERGQHQNYPCLPFYLRDADVTLKKVHV